MSFDYINHIYVGLLVACVYFSFVLTNCIINHIGNYIRRTWKTINEILTKNQTKNKFPTVFNDNGSMITVKVNLQINLMFSSQI